MEDCIFCKIVEGEIPCKLIYEDESTMAMLDINPGAPGHTLVLPKKHYDTIFDMPQEEICGMFRTVALVSKAINGAIKPDGVNVFQNNRLAAGQIVNHVHVHIFPRFRGDGIDFKWRRVVLDSEDLDRIAEKIKEKIE
jgi:histidine triad (HIT) family protein